MSNAELGKILNLDGSVRLVRGIANKEILYGVEGLGAPERLAMKKLLDAYDIQSEWIETLEKQRKKLTSLQSAYEAEIAYLRFQLENK